MKLAMVYNPKDNKLREESYCSIFRDMFDALAAKFVTQFIVDDCTADDIADADVIFFFDPHSSHHVKITGIEKHPAIKVEYWNDPHQQEVKGVYQSTGQKVWKLGREQRIIRAEEREIDYIVCPVRDFFIESFPELKDQLLWFPHAPKIIKGTTPYDVRKTAVLGNGATWGGYRGGYDFRAWAYKQPFIEQREHWIKDKNTPKGVGYLSFLQSYKASLALCTVMPVPKYYEIPAAGCVCFAEYHPEYEALGFKDFETCVYVDQGNIEDRVTMFLDNPEKYQRIADAGFALMNNNYTARHFAEFIFNSIKRRRPYEIEAGSKNTITTINKEQR